MFHGCDCGGVETFYYDPQGLAEIDKISTDKTDKYDTSSETQIMYIHTNDSHNSDLNSDDVTTILDVSCDFD